MMLLNLKFNVPQHIGGIAPPFSVLGRRGLFRPHLALDNQPLQPRPAAYNLRRHPKAKALAIHDSIYHIEPRRVFAYSIVIHSSILFLLPHRCKSDDLQFTCNTTNSNAINNSMPCLRISFKSNAIRNLSQIIHHINSVSLLTPNFR